MTEGFSSETTEDRINGHNRKELWPSVLYPAKISFSNEREIKTLSNEEKGNRIYYQITPKKLAKGSFLNRKDMIKEGILKQQVGKKNMHGK